ncbi:spermidine/putrescine ABC transporter substrate-binding protein [Halostella sp. JP-L12]|uniref:polyamine ABC transporter substrate-binding protein n=1 Tax=Halostella TaxID=1843185 RepID=UPI000EF82165|nr:MULTISPECIES: spermidine/putrescine ABC transporter substrate-binding protein [Halostella]NHN48038.1 spermidine/putrescine ABC transporter substrate-binding protein [Halostella sp. JP-L12]
MDKVTSTDRRTFLKATGAALGAAAFAGCSSSGDGSSNTLKIYQWGDYWPDGFVQGFEDETDISVNVSNYASNEEMFNTLQAGGTDQYDLIFPSDYMINILVEQEMIQPLDMDAIPNYENLADRFSNPPYDGDSETYAAPYQWGTSGIAYNENMTGWEVDISSWEVLWNEDFAGQITMLDDVRETMGAALKYLGHSLNTTDEGEIEVAKELLIEQKDLLKTYDSSTFKTNLINEEASPVHGWSGDVFGAYWETYDDEEGTSPIHYGVPEEGGVVWVDNGAVTADAQNPDAAHEFINYFLEAENAAEVTNWTYYGSPNEAAEEHINEEILNNESIYPSDETMSELEFIQNVGEATQLYNDAWDEIKSA